MDKIPWDSEAKLVIIDDLSITSKSIAIFSSSVTVPSYLTQHNVESQKKMRVHVFNIVGGMGGGLGHVKVESRATLCFACL